MPLPLVNCSLIQQRSFILANIPVLLLTEWGLNMQIFMFKLLMVSDS